MKIKTTIRYHFTSIRVAIIKKNKEKKRSGEDVEKFEHLYIAAGHVKLCIGYEKWYHKFNFKLTSKF